LLYDKFLDLFSAHFSYLVFLSQPHAPRLRAALRLKSRSLPAGAADSSVRDTWQTQLELDPARASVFDVPFVRPSVFPISLGGFNSRVAVRQTHKRKAMSYGTKCSIESSLRRWWRIHSVDQVQRWSSIYGC